MARRPQRAAKVVSLSEARAARRLSTYRERFEKVLRANRRAVSKLYVSGRLFTRAGARMGRDLLTAHEHLLRAVTLVDRLADVGDVPAPRRPSEVEAVFRELDTLLARTAQLTESTTELLEGLKRD